ncbi:MAG: LicD family protein, partial [Bacteroidales bacterium]|nr:LicD family protein [Bacteroidales bacterium]
MEKTALRRLQLVELAILDEFARRCEAHGLRYFLAYGTLIGAVRHKGFIPWDDDVDVGMPREDYEKFILLCKKDQGGQFYLQEYRTYQKYWHIYAKFRKNNTRKIEADPPPPEPGEHRGINIDIFPYDEVSPYEGIKKAQNFLITKLKFLLFEKRGYQSKNGSFITASAKKGLAKLAPFCFLHAFSHALMTLALGKCTEMVSWGGTDGYKKETFSKEVFFPLKKMEFEGREFAVPRDARRYL